MPNYRYQQAKKVTVLGASINFFLGILKLIGGFLLHSHALVADGFHSLADLLTDSMVIFASKYGSQNADSRHPYGHQRIETAATFFLAMLLILTGCGIAWEAFVELVHKQHDMPGYLTLPIAILSILMNEGLFHYTYYIGRQIQSNLLIANAWHHRSDAASSLIVLIGLLGSIFGLPTFDPIAAIIIGCLIIKMGIEYGWNSINELIDTGVDDTTLNNIVSIVQQTEGVFKIHQLRTRMMGRDIFVDVHILVSPFISVSEGHFIAQNVHYSLLNTISQIKDVTVHVDREDDEQGSPALHSPNRSTLEQNFLQKWQNDYPEIQSWQIHYLTGNIIIDLMLDHAFKKWEKLKARIDKDLQQHVHNISVRLFHRML